jgi:DNA-binding LytR/AlgR family response regulator
MNCIIVDDDELTRYLLQTLVSDTDSLNLVKTCSTPLEASDVLLREKIDLIFLDVMMPGMTGIEFLNTLGENRPEIILISNSKEFAADAFDSELCDFIEKPITQSRFLKAVSKAKKICDARLNPPGNESFFINVNSVLKKINLSDIFYIQALEDFISIYTVTGKHTVRSTMKDILNKLPKNDFIRVHNSYIIRLDKITGIEGNCLILNQQAIPVSRSKQKDIMKRIKLL